jgi:hypothetical protein
LDTHFELSSATTGRRRAQESEGCPDGIVDELSARANGLVDRLWRWEFLVLGRPSREMTGDGGLFAQAIARGAEILEVERG